MQQEEIPVHVLENGRSEIRFSEPELTTVGVLAFISLQVISNVSASLLVSWVKEKLFRRNSPRMRVEIMIEEPNGSVISMNADDYSADDVGEILREIRRK